jgi:hypothetical protein
MQDLHCWSTVSVIKDRRRPRTTVPGRATEAGMVRTRAGFDAAPEQVAAVLRERIYGGVACLGTLLVLLGHPEADATAWIAVADVAVTAGGLWAASVFADFVAHLAAYGQGPGGPEASRLLRASAQILEASAVPLLLLVIAGLGGMELDTALVAGVWVSVVTLGLFALLAARRTPLSLWKRAVLVLALVALGALVVAVKTLAH